MVGGNSRIHKPYIHTAFIGGTDSSILGPNEMLGDWWIHPPSKKSYQLSTLSDQDIKICLKNSYLQPVCPLFLARALTPPKQGLFQSKQGKPIRVPGTER